MTILTRVGRPLLRIAATLVVLLTGVAPASAVVPKSVHASAAVPGLAWVSATSITSPIGGSLPPGPFASTADGGATWVPSRSGEVAGPDPLLRWAASAAGVDASTDGGVSWHALPSFSAALGSFPASGSQYLQELAADPARPGVVYAVVSIGYDKSSVVEVIESTDGGASWTIWPTSIGKLGSYLNYVASTPVPGRDALLVEHLDTRPHLRNELVLATPSSAKIIDASRVSNTPTGGRWDGPISIDRSGTRVLLPMAGGGFVLSTDGGVHVREINASYAALDPSAKGRLFALRGADVWHSSDDGRHWRRRGRVAGATGLAIDRGGRLVYAYGGSGVSLSRDGGATFRQLGAFVGSAVTTVAPELAAAGDHVIGSLPSSVDPSIVDQAPHSGQIAAAPTGDAVVIPEQSTSDIRSADGTWHTEPLGLVVDSFPAIDAHGVGYLVTAIDDTGPGVGIQYSIKVSTHPPGGTWSPLVTAATTSLSVTGRPVITSNAAGDMLIVYFADGVWATVLRAGAPAWSAPVKISADDVVSRVTLLASGGGAGTFVVAWDSGPALAGSATIPRAARIGATGDWSPPVDILPLPGSGVAPVSDSTLAVDSGGNGLILAATATGTESFTWGPGAAGWTAGAAVAPPAGAGEANGMPAFAIAPDGTATAVYTHADAHELSLRDSTSHAPYAAWTPDPADAALVESCPAGDCLAASPAVARSFACESLCLAWGLPPVVASVASHTVAAFATSRGLLVLSRSAGATSWVPARSDGAGEVTVDPVVVKGAVRLQIACSFAPCTSQIVLETAVGSPLGDRVQIATVTANLASTSPVSRTIRLSAWARAAIARAGSLPIHVVVESQGDELAAPIVSQDAVLRAS